MTARSFVLAAIVLSPLLLAADKPCFEGKTVPVIAKSRADERAKLKHATAALPKNDAGMPILMAIGDSSLAIDLTRPDDGISVLAQCTGLWTECLDPKHGRQLDDCVASTPVCATEKPWLEPNFCCPKKCVEAYSAARCRGRKDIEALTDLISDKRSCSPNAK